MNKYISAIILVIAVTVLAVGLNAVLDVSQDIGEETKIQISGSTTCLPIIEECALAYMELNPDTKVFVAAGGSSAGIKAVHDDISEIGMASRDLKPEELTGVVTTIIARDDIAIIVHPENPINDITSVILNEIYTGKIIEWESIDGDAGSIMICTREQGSGTRSVFEKIIMGEDEIIDVAIVAPSNGIMRKTVGGNPAGIGYISAGYVDETVKALTVDIDVGRNLYLITNEVVTPEVEDFINFVLSDAGQEIVATVGFVPV